MVDSDEDQVEKEDSEKEALEGESVEINQTTSESDEEVSGEDETPESIASELENVLLEIEKHKDAALRAEAEMQNMRKRTAREIESAHKYGLEKFLQNLLPVIDSLEKASEIGVAEQDLNSDAISEGVSLCHKLLVDVLGKEGVTSIDPLGEPFNPSEHQAMSMVENSDMEPNSVAAVVQKGWKIQDRLLRAAMVMVVKGSDDE